MTLKFGVATRRQASNASCICISLLSEESAIALWSNSRTKLIVGAGLNPENGKRRWADDRGGRSARKSVIYVSYSFGWLENKQFKDSQDAGS